CGAPARLRLHPVPAPHPGVGRAPLQPAVRRALGAGDSPLARPRAEGSALRPPLLLRRGAVAIRPPPSLGPWRQRRFDALLGLVEAPVRKGADVAGWA